MNVEVLPIPFGKIPITSGLMLKNQSYSESLTSGLAFSNKGFEQSHQVHRLTVKLKSTNLSVSPLLPHLLTIGVC